MLLGKKVDTTKLGGANGLSFVLPLAAVITKDNLADGLKMCEGKPDAYLLDKILTDDEVQQYFVKEDCRRPRSSRLAFRTRSSAANTARR